MVRYFKKDKQIAEITSSAVAEDLLNNGFIEMTSQEINNYLKEKSAKQQLLASMHEKQIVLNELDDWFNNYFDKQIKQSLWQEDFIISHDDYFDKDYANLDELKVQANKVRTQIKLLRQEVNSNGKRVF